MTTIFNEIGCKVFKIQKNRQKSSIFAKNGQFVGRFRQKSNVFLIFEHFLHDFIKNGCHGLESPAQGASAQPKKIEIGPKLDPLGQL